MLLLAYYGLDGRRGLWWGLLVYGVHFLWLLQATLTHTQLGLGWALLVYGAVVAYFAGFTGLWFLVCSRVWQPLSLLTYWYVIAHYVLIPLGLNTGYPLASPTVPLYAHGWFLRMIGLTVSLVSPNEINYMSPVINRLHDWHAPWARSPHAVAQRFGAQHIHTSAELCVGPESLFPFALNQHQELLPILTHNNTQHEDRIATLAHYNTQQHYIFGSLLKQDGQIYQVAYHVHKNLIINFYVKKLLVPFVEQPVTGLLGQLGSWVLAEYEPMSAGLQAQGAEVFSVPMTTGTSTSVRTLVPRICLEFFLQDTASYAQYKKNSIKQDASRQSEKDSVQQDILSKRHEVALVNNVWVLVLVNDSWFTQQLRTILQLVARKKSHAIGLRVVYIGHTGCYTMTP